MLHTFEIWVRREDFKAVFVCCCYWWWCWWRRMRTKLFFPFHRRSSPFRFFSTEYTSVLIIHIIIIQCVYVFIRSWLQQKRPTEWTEWTFVAFHLAYFLNPLMLLFEYIKKNVKMQWLKYSWLKLTEEGIVGIELWWNEITQNSRKSFARSELCQDDLKTWDEKNGNLQMLSTEMKSQFSPFSHSSVQKKISNLKISFILPSTPQRIHSICVLRHRLVIGKLYKKVNKFFSESFYWSSEQNFCCMCFGKHRRWNIKKTFSIWKNKMIVVTRAPNHFWNLSRELEWAVHIPSPPLSRMRINRKLTLPWTTAFVVVVLSWYILHILFHAF